MIYTRKDVIGQVETFEGEPIEIMGMIKLLKLEDDNKITIDFDEDGMLNLFVNLDGDEEEEHYE